jgi:hypothetical protein
LEARFLELLIEPNDGQRYGRAVKHTVHQLWHKQKQRVHGVEYNFDRGGPFNAAWRKCVEDQNATETGELTVEAVEQFLQKIRSEPVEFYGEAAGGRRQLFRASFTDPEDPRSFLIEAVR